MGDEEVVTADGAGVEGSTSGGVLDLFSGISEVRLFNLMMIVLVQWSERVEHLKIIAAEVVCCLVDGGGIGRDIDLACRVE